MDWTQTLTIIATLLGVTAWLDYKHREDLKALKEDMTKMDERQQEDKKATEERWKWLFDWAHAEIDVLKFRNRPVEDLKR